MNVDELHEKGIECGLNQSLTLNLWEERFCMDWL